MNTNTSSGQPRVLSLEEFAALIRKMREVFQWSQETLAELAGLNVGTVQRVENAKSASTDINHAEDALNYDSINQNKLLLDNGDSI